MATVEIAHRPRNCNAIARRRDAFILWLLHRHPATAGMLVEIGLFQTRTRAAKRLRRLLQKKHLRLAGTVSLSDGRPEQVYYRGRHVKADNVLHEVQVSRLCFRTHAQEVRRGPDVIDPMLLPDAELVINGQRYLLEFDTGSMDLQVVVRTRFAKYRSCPDLVLWVCATPARMEALRRYAEALRETALFTTLDLALRDPHAAIWFDFDGNKAALPRARKGGVQASSQGGT